MVFGNKEFTTKQRKCQNILNVYLSYYSSVFLRAINPKDCKNVTENGIGNKTPYDRLRNLPRL